MKKEKATSYEMAFSKYKKCLKTLLPFTAGTAAAKTTTTKAAEATAASTKTTAAAEAAAKTTGENNGSAKATVTAPRHITTAFITTSTTKHAQDKKQDNDAEDNPVHAATTAAPAPVGITFGRGVLAGCSQYQCIYRTIKSALIVLR